MRAVVQRVSAASVKVDDVVTGQIERGFLVLVGVGEDDTEQDAVYLAGKVSGLRVFEDESGRMNRTLTDVRGQVLAVSQFTLFGDCRKGRRPSFISAASPDTARHLYQTFIAELKGQGLCVETGHFQAHMQVSLVNDGPVTLLLDSHKTF